MLTTQQQLHSNDSQSLLVWILARKQENSSTQAEFCCLGQVSELSLNQSYHHLKSANILIPTQQTQLIFLQRFRQTLALVFLIKGGRGGKHSTQISSFLAHKQQRSTESTTAARFPSRLRKGKLAQCLRKPFQMLTGLTLATHFQPWAD